MFIEQMPMSAGEYQHFQAIYDRYSGPLLRFVYRFTGNQEQAEEILQDVFTEFLRADLFTKDEAEQKAWLFTVAKNKSLNFERKKKWETASDKAIASSVDSHHLEAVVEHRQLLRRLSEVQKNLPEDLATTWKLRQQGMDYQEIAQALEIPVGTVKSRFNRLVEYLKKEFQ